MIAGPPIGAARDPDRPRPGHPEPLRRPPRHDIDLDAKVRFKQRPGGVTRTKPAFSTTRQPLKDAVAAAREAVAMIEGVDAERCAATSVLVREVERCIVISGEALTHVDEAAREAHPEVPWRAIIGMRNLLARGYFRVDPMVLWTTVSRDLPELIRDLEKILSNG